MPKRAGTNVINLPFCTHRVGVSMGPQDVPTQRPHGFNTIQRAGRSRRSRVEQKLNDMGGIPMASVS